MGIPTASIITHVFLNTAKAMTRMMGVPDYEFVVAEHPLSILTASQNPGQKGVFQPEHQAPNPAVKSKERRMPLFTYFHDLQLAGPVLA